MNVELIIWYVVLIDSVVANLMVWFSLKFMNWYKKIWFAKFFPMTKGWAAFYFILVLWIGYCLSRMGILS